MLPIPRIVAIPRQARSDARLLCDMVSLTLDSLITTNRVRTCRCHKIKELQENLGAGQSDNNKKEGQSQNSPTAVPKSR